MTGQCAACWSVLRGPAHLLESVSVCAVLLLFRAAHTLLPRTRSGREP